MQSHPHRQTHRCFISLLISYVLILLPVPFTSSASANREHKELFSRSGSFSAASPQQNKAAHRTGELLVRFRDGVSEPEKLEAIGNDGARGKKKLRGDSAIEKLALAAGQDPETVAQTLRLNPAVEFAEPNFLIRPDELQSELKLSSNLTQKPNTPFDPKTLIPDFSFKNVNLLAKPQAQGTQPNDPRFSEQWSLSNTGQNGGQFGSDIDVTNAWQITTGSHSTIIAVIDSGIDFTHPDLTGNKWTNSASGADGDLNGWDYITDSGAIIDEQGHGTAIAGIIAAQGNNAIGITGVMWQASLMSLRVLDNTGTGDIAHAVEAIDYAVTHGAQVINISWGTSAESFALKDAIERAIRHGVVVVCSAGNNGQNLDYTPYYPASFNIRNLLSVASSDTFDQLPGWSNWGRRQVTVAAPGVNVLTTQMSGGYRSVTGTSASAPLVSGIAGLMKTERPWLSAASIQRAIVDGVRRVTGLTGKVAADGVVSASGALGALRGPANQPGNGSRGISPQLPDTGRNDGSHSRKAEIPSSVPSDNSETPNLDAIRNKPSHVPKALSAPIQANLMCADCDPQGGGGGGGYYPPSDPNFSTSRKQPQNETGEAGVDLGSRNFNWSLPLLSLPGRAGLDVNLTLFYNSLVWTKDGSFIKYNADLGTPAPGFRLSLPILQQQFLNPTTGIWAYMMLTPSGSRVEMRRVGSSSVYESQDSTYTHLDVSNPSAPVVRTTDGTQFKFTPVSVNNEFRCVEIKDRNGNFISASYNTTNGHLQTITDTLGRVITFVYNVDNNLQAIRQTWNGVAHDWATFSYGQVWVAPAFGGGLQINGPNNNFVTVLTQVNLHGGSFYTFEYNAAFGQVKKFNHFAPDSHLLAYTSYNVSSSAGQTDCPRFTERRDWVEFGVMQTSAETVTTYAVAADNSWGTVTLPDDTPANPNDNIVQKEYFATTGWQKGLTIRSEVFLAGSPAVLKKWTTISWTQDDINLTFQKNPRPTEINVYDEASNRRRATIEYHSSFGLPFIVTEYAADASTVLRRTSVDYKNDAVYINRRIIGLPFRRSVYDGSWNLMAKTEYGYDWDFAGDMFQDTPAPATQHDRTNYGPTFITGRGNLSQTARFDITDPNNTSNTIVEMKWRVNSTGSVLMERDHDWHQTFFAYGDSFSDGVNRNTFAYQTSNTDAEGYQSTIKYKYEIGAITETRRPSSGTNAQSNVTYETFAMLYDSVGRLERVTNQNSGFYTRFVYPSSMGYVQSYRNVKPGAAEDYSVDVFDGLGRVRRTARFMPQKTDRYSAQMIHYNSLGQVVKRSKLTEILGDWTPTGPDDAGSWVYTDQAYDWQGRPTVTTRPDGWTSELSYTGCGCAGGEVVTVRDEAGRRRKLYNDVLGRLWKVEELNWDQSVYSTTTYTYNVRDQLTQMSQQGQTRTLNYDGHGRLWKRTTPEQGQMEYSYNKDDTLKWVKDARGVKTNFSYSSRHQRTSISYDLANVLPGQNVAATAGVTMQYDAGGNRTLMSDGLGSVTYSYDNMSRLQWEERNFTGIGIYRLTYAYDNAGLASITNPWGSQVSYAHDHTGSVTGITGSGAVSAGTYASGMQYRAFGSLKAISYGNTRQLSVTYDSRMRPLEWNVAGLLGSEYRYDYFHEHTGRVTFARNLYDSTLDRSYEYDQAARLSWTYSGAEASAHAFSGQWGTQNGPYAQANFYDQFGNITQRLGWGTTNPSFTASYTNNRRNGFSYDLAGNLTNEGQAFTYDATGQQVSASFSGFSLTQGYNGDGLRVKKTENGTTIYSLRSTVLGSQVVAEIANFGGTWGWMRGYVQLGFQLIAVQQDGQVRWVHEDPVTKTKRMTDAAGNPISTVVFDPWGGDVGGTWSQNVSQQRRRFTTYERDGNNSDEAMMRRYNRWYARFDQPDPFDGNYSLTNPQSFNRYSYVRSDPINFVDPTGLDGDCAAEHNATGSCTIGDGGPTPINPGNIIGLGPRGGGPTGGGTPPTYGPGGVGGIPQNPQPPSLPDAINLAKMLLEDPKGPCAGLFKKGNGLSTLQKLEKDNKIKIKDVKTSVFGGPKRPLSSMPNVSAVNTKEGVFINPVGRIARGDPSPTGPFAALTPLEAMAALIVHETAHRTGDFPYENTPEDSSFHSIDVVDACFPGW